MQVVEINGAELLVDDGARPRRGVLDVESLVVDELLHLLRFRVVFEKGDGAIAVREEVDLVANPKRIAVIGVVARDLHDAGIG